MEQLKISELYSDLSKTLRKCVDRKICKSSSHSLY